MEQPSRIGRDEALAKWRQAYTVKRSDETRRLPIAERRRIQSEYQDASREYYRTLQQVRISTCPFDHSPVFKAMDVFGIDGPWWDVKGWDGPPTGDNHVVTYRGALLGAEQLAREVPAGFEIHIGPAAPFVIPRLLEKQEVVCVISKVAILTGAYVITYFADPPIPPADSAEPWLRRTYSYTDERGFERWNARDDPWEFDIGKWIERGKVYWIAPDDPAQSPVTGRRASLCPFVNLPGARSPRMLTSSGVAPLPAPVGINAMDLFD